MRRLLLALAGVSVLVGTGLAGGASSKPTTTDPNNPVRPLTLVSTVKTASGSATTETRTYRDAAGQTFRLTITANEGPLLNGGTDAPVMYQGTAPHGCRKMIGHAKWDNYVTVNRRTMYTEVYWGGSNWTVQTIWGNNVRPESSCCNWTWANVTDNRVTPAGYSHFWFYAGGHWNWCFFGFCNNMYPTIQQRGNGAGHRTALIVDTG